MEEAGATMEQEREERLTEIRRLRYDEGLTLEEIGTMIGGVSRQRVAQLLADADDLFGESKDKPEGLSVSGPRVDEDAIAEAAKTATSIRQIVSETGHWYYSVKRVLDERGLMTQLRKNRRAKMKPRGAKEPTRGGRNGTSKRGGRRTG